MWKSGVEKSLEKRQAYVLAREAFHVMHPEADLPLAAKGLVWTDEGGDKFILEADGAKVFGDNRTPARWIVNLRHEVGQWIVDESHWK